MFFEEAGNYAASKVMRKLTDENQTKTIKVPMLASKDYTFSSIETNSKTEWITGIDVSLPMFTIGNLNIVEFDGREYECETVNKGGGGRYVGFGRSGLSDTGTNVPFSVRLDTKEGRMMVSCYTDAGLPEGAQITHTFAVYDTETIHPISDKYLSGVCLPVVELETVVANEAMLSEADAAKLEKVIGLPIVLKMTNQAGEKMASLANYFADGEANAFITAGDTPYIFMDEAGTGEWTIITNG